MKQLTIALTIVALAALAGCNNVKKSSMESSNTPVNSEARTTTPPPPPPMVQPVQPVQPVSDTSPVIQPMTTVTPTATASGGSVYTVQKGDTLFKIARAKYGDPSAVKKIKEANPGMNPDQIKVGQKINLP